MFSLVPFEEKSARVATPLPLPQPHRLITSSVTPASGSVLRIPRPIFESGCSRSDQGLFRWMKHGYAHLSATFTPAENMKWATAFFSKPEEILQKVRTCFQEFCRDKPGFIHAFSKTYATLKLTKPLELPPELAYCLREAPEAFSDEQIEDILDTMLDEINEGCLEQLAFASPKIRGLALMKAIATPDVVWAKKLVETHPTMPKYEDCIDVMIHAVFHEEELVPVVRRALDLFDVGDRAYKKNDLRESLEGWSGDEELDERGEYEVILKLAEIAKEHVALAERIMPTIHEYRQQLSQDSPYLAEIQKLCGEAPSQLSAAAGPASEPS